MTVILNKNLEIVDSYPLGTFIQGFTYSHDNGSSGVYKQKKNFKLFIDLVKLNEPSYKVGQIVNYRDQVLAVDYQGGIHTSKMYLPLKNISPVMSESSNSDLIIYTANVIYIYHNLFKNSSLTEIKSKSGVFKSYCSTKSYIIYSEESEISIYDKNLRISSKIDAKNNNNEQILCDTESDSFMSLSHDKRNGIRYDLIGK